MSTIPSPQTASKAPWYHFTPLWRWLDADYFPNGAQAERDKPDKFDWNRCMSFVFLHVGCLGLFFVGWSWTAVWVAVAAYVIRMFAVTGIYHRYFSHRTYKTSRFGQFLLAVLGNTAVQRGALWWASVHRHHHQHSDHEEDVHSPIQHGFLWAHIGWMTSSRNFPTDYGRVKDLARFPELVFLNRFDLLIPALLAAAAYGFGAALNALWPGLGTSGWQMLVWVFFVSTCFLLHGTLFINSLAHVFGKRRYETEDTSRNSFILAMITLGEGWHNNHHHCMTSVRQGFFWWEIDITFYILKALSWTGFIWDLRPVPSHAYEKNLIESPAAAQAPEPKLVLIPASGPAPALEATGFAKLGLEARHGLEAAKHGLEAAKHTGIEAAKHGLEAAKHRLESAKQSLENAKQEIEAAWPATEANPSSPSA